MIYKVDLQYRKLWRIPHEYFQVDPAHIFIYKGITSVCVHLDKNESMQCASRTPWFRIPLSYLTPIDFSEVFNAL